MKYFSLFSGIGGFELGIEKGVNVSYKSEYKEKNTRCGCSMDTGRNGNKTISDIGWEQQQYFEKNNSKIIENKRKEFNSWKCVGFSEIDKYAIQIYKKHFPEHKNYGDATKINTRELPDFDFLVAGFPCQAFSYAGGRKGFDDARGTLFFEIARILRDKRPRYFLLENVKGLLSHDEGKTIQKMFGVLTDLRYQFEWQVLNSKDFGVPQSRERIFIVGYSGNECRPKIFPIQNSETIYTKKNHGKRKERARVQSKIAPTIDARYGSLRNAGEPYIIHNIYGGFKEEKPREFKEYSPTIRTPQGGGHIPNVVEGMQIRKLTPVECERLQGFPDNWTGGGISDTQRYKCIGNAVTVNVVEAIIRKLIEGAVQMRSKCGAKTV